MLKTSLTSRCEALKKTPKNHSGKRGGSYLEALFIRNPRKSVGTSGRGGGVGSWKSKCKNLGVLLAKFWVVI